MSAISTRRLESMQSPSEVRRGKGGGGFGFSTKCPGPYKKRDKGDLDRLPFPWPYFFIENLHIYIQYNRIIH